MRALVAVALLVGASLVAFGQEPVREKLDHPLRRIEGVVQRESGETLPNIDVEVFGGQSIVATARTDSKGRFRTDSLEPGEYEVWFSYKSRPVFRDAEYTVKIDPKGSKEPWVVKLKSLSSAQQQ